MQDTVRRPDAAKSMRSGVLLVLLGTAVAQGILIVSLPLIARLYSPADFGTYAYLTSSALVIAGLANLRLDGAVPLPRSEETLTDVIWLATCSAAAVALLTGGILVVTGAHVPPDHVLASEWAKTLPVMVFVIAQFALWNQVALRQQLFTVVAKRPLAQNMVTVALQLGLVPCRLGAGGLILGQLIARTVTTALIIWSCKTKFRLTTRNRMRRTLRRYAEFPLIMAPAAVLNVLGLYLPLLLTAHFYGKAAGGLVGLAQQLVFLPAATVGVAVGQVYIAQLSRNRREKRTGNYRTFMQATGALGACALAFAVLVALLSPRVLPTLLGETWVDAGPIAVALTLSSACGLVAAPLSNVLVIFERSKTILLLDAARVALVASAGLTAVSLQGSTLQAVIAVSAAQALVYLLTWCVSLAVVRSPQWR